MADETQQNDNQFKVKLADSTAGDRITDRRATVTFDVTPDLIENRNVNYKSLDPIHAPGQLQVYQSTSSRTFNLSNVRLVSRTRQEASLNLLRLWTLRGWTMPAFGQDFVSQANAQKDLSKTVRDRFNDGVAGLTEEIVSGIHKRDELARRGGGGIEFLGAPPKVLLLSAYSRVGAVTGTRGIGHIRRVPVVIQQLSIPYPSDVDYIPTADAQPTPMPTLMTLDMTLVETHSPAEYESFSLQDFREGNLKGF